MTVQLRQTAISLRDKINQLLNEHESDLGEGLADQLIERDIDNRYLPYGQAELRCWIDASQAIIDETEKFLSQSSVKEVSMDTLAALAARFNSH
jgi:hypothetical protein